MGDEEPAFEGLPSAAVAESMDSTIMNSLAEENTQNAVFTNQTIFL